MLESDSLKSEALVKTFSMMFRVRMSIFSSNLSKSLLERSVSFVASLDYSLSVLLVVSFGVPKEVA